MKKMIALVVVVLLCMTALVACSSGTPAESPSASTAEESSSEAPASSSADASAAESSDDTVAEGDSAPTKVLYLVTGNLGDKSFFDSGNEGMALIKSELGCETSVVELGYDNTKWEPALLEASEQDWDVIIVGTAQVQEILEEVAAQFPEQRYIIFDTTAAGDNIYSIEYKQNEGSYLVGMVAAEFSVSGYEGTNPEAIIGTVGGMDIPVINDFMIGYIEGAKAVNPDIKVAISHIGNFDDTAKAKELAMTQISTGADIIYNLCAQAGLGIFDAAVDKNTYALGVDTDQAMALLDTDPDKAERIVSSVVRDIGASLLYAVEKHIEGTLEYGTTEKLGIAEGAVTIAKNDFYNEMVSQEVRDKVDQAEKDIAAGTIVVPSAYDMSTEEIMEIRESVSPN